MFKIVPGIATVPKEQHKQVARKKFNCTSKNKGKTLIEIILLAGPAPENKLDSQISTF